MDKGGLAQPGLAGVLSAEKVAVVAYSAPPYSSGGVASAHFNLFRLLQRAGRNARLFTFGETGREDSADIIRRGTPIGLSKVVRKITALFFGLAQPGKIAYQLADILKSAIGARRMSSEITKFDPSVIVLSDHGAPGWMLKKPKKTKIILVSHHNPARFLSISGTSYSKLDTRLALRLEQKVLSKVDVVVCPSEYMKTWFEKTYLFSGPVKAIPNLVDEEFLKEIAPLDLRSQFNLSSDAVLIYMPAAGSLLKGADYLLEIVAQVCELTDKFVGFYIPGEISAEVLDKAAELPDRARLCLSGPLSYEEHIGNVKACSFGISPSLIENYSMALLEAVHCGVPMLAFETGGNADIIRHGKNGYLVREGDVAAICKLAAGLLKPAALQILRESTLATSRLQLASQLALDAYLKLMDDLCSE